jgi:hypothetical protein
MKLAPVSGAFFGLGTMYILTGSNSAVLRNQPLEETKFRALTCPCSTGMNSGIRRYRLRSRLKGWKTIHFCDYVDRVDIFGPMSMPTSMSNG